MAISHEVTIRNALADLIDDRINSGTINLGGQIVFQTSGNVEVATVTFSNPAFGAASNGVITANPITADTSATGGVTTNFKATDRNGNTVLTGSVTASGGGGDIELSSTTIGAGDTVTVTSFTYEASV